MISDTDVVSNPTFLKPIPSVTTFLNWLGDRLLIAFPTVLELRYGIERVRKTDPEKTRRLEEWADELIARSDKLSMSSNVSKVYAEMLDCKELNNLWMHNGKPRRPRLKLDLFIAAFAKFYKMPIATRNTKDFIQIARHFELPGIYNPATGVWVATAGVLPPHDLPGLTRQDVLLPSGCGRPKAASYSSGVSLGGSTRAFRPELGVNDTLNTPSVALSV